MTAPNIRLIATDLDGTFLGEDSRLLPQNAQAFRRAQERGIHVCIASGRLANVCSRMARDMGLDGCHIIGMNGAQMLLSPFAPPLINLSFPDVVRDRCLSVIAELLLQLVHLFGRLYQPALHPGAQGAFPIQLFRLRCERRH